MTQFSALEAEVSVIGALMLRPEVLHSFELRVDEFTDPKCKFAYEAICNLVYDQTPVDTTTVEAELCRLGRKLPTIGDVVEMAARVPTAANVGHYARLVRLAAVRRSVLLALSEQQERIRTCDVEEVVANLETMQRAVLASCNTRGRFQTPTQLFQEMIDRFRSDPATRPRRIKTGISAIDIIIGGLPLAHPTMIGGRTSSGKTALMRNIVDNVASGGTPAGYITLEDSPLDLFQWQALRRARIGIERVIQEAITVSEIARIEQFRREMTALPLCYCHEGALTGPQICQRARQMVTVEGARLVVVDFLHRARVPGERGRNEELADIVNLLVDLAHETGIAIVIGAQLNRTSDKENRPPELTDFKDCGGIEESAEVAILAHRQWRMKTEKPRPPRYAKLFEAIVAKMKQGEVQTAKCYFEGSFGYVCDPEPGYFDDMDQGVPFCETRGCQKLAIYGEHYCGLHLESTTQEALTFVGGRA